MMSELRQRLIEVLKTVAPLIGVICLFQLLLVHAPIAQFLQFLLGAGLATIGMLLLFMGVDLGVLPMGRRRSTPRRSGC